MADEQDETAPYNIGTYKAAEREATGRRMTITVSTPGRPDADAVCEVDPVLDSMQAISIIANWNKTRAQEFIEAVLTSEGRKVWDARLANRSLPRIRDELALEIVMDLVAAYTGSPFDGPSSSAE